MDLHFIIYFLAFLTFQYEVLSLESYEKCFMNGTD